MATTPAPAPKISFLKHLGQIMGKILAFVAGPGGATIDKAATLAEIVMPQFAPEIAAAQGIADRIVKQVIVTETVTTGVGAATTGTDKLAAAVAGIGPEIDQWIANLFPGSGQVSEAKKAGLVSAIADIVNEQSAAVTTPLLAPGPPPPPPPPPPLH
jgi:hypothetical protein